MRKIVVGPKKPKVMIKCIPTHTLTPYPREYSKERRRFGCRGVVTSSKYKRRQV